MSAEARPAGTAQVHPLTLAVVRHKLLAVAEEIVETMIQTSFSPLLNQSHDFSAVVLDGAGNLLAQAERVPIHMGAIGFSVKAMAEAFAGDIEDGDVLAANDPFWGGSHLPDITVAMPIFRQGKVRLWIANRSHMGDIGGLSAGGYSAGAREIWHEGLRIPPVKCVERGAVSEDLMRLVCENTRKPEDTRGDIMAQIASVRVGAERLNTLFERYGADEVERVGEAIIRTGEAAMRAQLRRWNPGTYEATINLDDDGEGNALCPIHCRITLEGDEAAVDLSGSADQPRSILNSPYANTNAAVHVAFMMLADDDQVLNEGSFHPIRVITRKGSICDPVPPAPVVGSTTYAAPVIIETVIKAMERAAPKNVVGGNVRRFRYVLAGEDRHGRSYIWHYFFNRGGGGAALDTDGWCNLGASHNPGGIRAPSIERTESHFPFLIERYGLLPDSAGAGQARGGLGGLFVMRYEGDGPAVLNAAGDGVVVPPAGVGGGHDGKPNRFRLVLGERERPLGTKEHGVVLNPGDRVITESAGGGGYGDPRARARAKVAEDLVEGYISPEAARDIYGYDPGETGDAKGLTRSLSKRTPPSPEL